MQIGVERGRIRTMLRKFTIAAVVLLVMVVALVGYQSYLDRECQKQQNLAMRREAELKDDVKKLPAAASKQAVEEFYAAHGMKPEFYRRRNGQNMAFGRIDIGECPHLFGGGVQVAVFVESTLDEASRVESSEVSTHYLSSR
jgi:hypothetical protein